MSNRQTGRWLTAFAGALASITAALSAPATAQEPAKPAVTRRADLSLAADTPRPAPVAAAVFAERSAFCGEALSPDGTALSYLQPLSKERLGQIEELLAKG